MPRKRSQHHRRPRAASVLGLLLIVSLVLPLVVPQSSYAQETSVPIVRSSDIMDVAGIYPPGAGTVSDRGLQLVLGEGVEQPVAVETPPLAQSQSLSAEQTAQLLDRLPPLQSDATDEVAFRLPPEPLPPPRTGNTIDEAFPPTQTAGAPVGVEGGPLTVLRYAPEGEVRIAPFLNVTFSQPMVPLATVEDLSSADVPVTLTPELPGVWRWIGTQTLSFEYAGDEVDRFPMATEYRAEIPAGTESATGGVLADSVQWSFTTPPPTVLRSEPSYGPQSRDPLFFVSFDQRIDQEAVLETIRVTASGNSYDVRLASEDEVAADKTISRLAEESGESRWLAFRSDTLFPSDTTVVVNIGPDTPSAEGPLTTTQVQSYSFQTYASLRIDDQRCDYYDNNGECPPLVPFEVVFNNRLDPDAFEESQVKVTPEIPGQVIEAIGSNLRIRGQTAGRTTYQVVIDGALQDVFGQTLGEDAELSFTTGSAPRALFGLGNNLITVDPSVDPPSISFYSINQPRLRVRAYAVTPQDWVAYQEYQRTYNYDGTTFTPPGMEVLSKLYSIEGEPDSLTETTIDLSQALDGDSGNLIVVVDDPIRTLFRRNRSGNDLLYAWVQVTQIGLDAFVDHSDLLAWTTSLASGKPLEKVTVTLGDSETAFSNANGLARIALPNTAEPILVAQRGSDTAILPYSMYYWGSNGFAKQVVRDEVRWHVFDDRAMYRPGEDVHLKGWLRKIGAKQDADVALVPGATSVRYQVFDPQGNQLEDGTTDVNDLGGFDLTFTLPENANLGYGNVYLTAATTGNVYGQDYYHGFQIQEFRRPEFEVSAQPDGEGPYFVGGEALVSVHAGYYAGGPLPNAETNWTVTSSPASYSPPNWPDFTFGVWTPWWGYYSDPNFDNTSSTSTYSAHTDASGAHTLSIGFPTATERRPYSVMAQAAVMDVNRQSWASSTSFLVHPARLYVGLRSDSTFVDAGDPLDIQAIVTDLDGNAVEDRPIEMSAARLEWKYEKGSWVEKEVDEQKCTVGSTLEPVTCTFETSIGGEYRISATIQDSEGRENFSQLTRWVSGGQRPPVRNVEREDADLIPDKEVYQPGDTAEILVQSPFAPAEGVLTLRRNGIVSSESFHMEDSTYTLQIPLLDEYIPNVTVGVDLVGAAPRVADDGTPRDNLPQRPAYASGTLLLEVSPHSRELGLTVVPADKELQPGDETSLDVKVVDADGDPVENAELAVVVVDEAILALTDYTLSNPLDTFYQTIQDGVQSYYGRGSIVLANADLVGSGALDEATSASGAQDMAEESFAMMEAPMPTMAAAAAPAAEGGGMMMDSARVMSSAPEEQAPISVRSDFNPLAVFEPAIRTDAEGNATVDYKLPDNLTRYRVMVRAVAGEKYFGVGETNVTARLPLMVRPAAPRFLNFGDSFELPIVLQNQTDTPATVDVAVRTGNLEMQNPLGLRVEVPANDRREVRFAANTNSAGTARIQIAAVSGDYADAATVELPVYTPATTEAFATYGVVDDGAIVQPVLAPSDVFTQFGGLEVNTSSTALQALTDAVIFLVSYPFECSEQIASRILGVTSLRDVLAAFQAEGLPSPEELNKAMDDDIARLQQMQNSDGGFPIWARGDPSIPFYSIHAALALENAKEKGYVVSEETLQRSLQYLRDIESYYPSWYSEMTRLALSAYALYVRDLMGDVDTAKARSLLNSKPLDDQSLEAIAWLWQVLSGDPSSTTEVDAIRRHINNHAVETAGAANFFTSYGDDEYVMLHSDRRTDAVVLDAMINDEPEGDLIPKVVNGLLAHRTAGHWRNTQENVFVLLALDRYFNTFEAQTPDFVARLWLGDTYVAEHEFQGYTTDTRTTTVPMAYLVDELPQTATGDRDAGGQVDMVLQKDGEGRLYYRLGMRYAPTDLTLDPMDMGFTVQRTYEAVDDPDDVVRAEDGVWHIKAGARVRVRIDMVANTRRYHVALVDPLPAGLESINPALAVSENVPGEQSNEPTPYRWWWGPWYEHQNLRDARAEAFTSLLWDGVYQYSYVARATTPGDYVVPPAKAEEMYSPEVFGRSASDRVIVE